MGLGDFVKGIGDAVVNVGKAAAWVANPTHLDDIAEGVGDAAKFVAKNPGKTWDTAFEVGRAVVKDQMDPMNLAINAGLLAATVATGGAAAPAFLAKAGLGAKSISAGVTATKGAQAAGTALKGAKALDTAGDIAKGVRTGAKVVDTVRDVTKTADTVTDAAKTGNKLMRAVDKGLGLEPGKFGRTASNIANPLENSRFGMAAMRERGAQKMLTAGGEAPSLARQAGAALLQGGGRGAGGPAQLAGMSDKVYQGQKMLARGQAVGKRAHQLGQFEEGVKVAADPEAAAMNAAADRMATNGVTGPGYEDRGQTGDVYSRQGAGGNAYGQPQGTWSANGQTGGWKQTSAGPHNPAAAAAAVGASGLTQPATGTSTSTAATATPRRQQTTENLYQQSEEVSQAASSSHRGMHLWEGPRSQYLGGIQSNYDWRKIDPLRPITTWSGGKSKSSSESDTSAPDQEITAPGTAVDRDLNAQGAPKDFAPQVDKGGNFALSTGQQPKGSAYPQTYMGEGASRGRSHNATNVRTSAQPIGAIGPGKAANNIIDADSSSPDDFKFDNSGQGYFDFSNTMGTAAVGQQPNTSPMYAQGSRTSSRSQRRSNFPVLGT